MQTCRASSEAGEVIANVVTHKIRDLGRKSDAASSRRVEEIETEYVCRKCDTMLREDLLEE